MKARCEAIMTAEAVRQGFVVQGGREPGGDFDFDDAGNLVPNQKCPNEADYVFEELQGQCREVALCDQHTYAFLNNPNMPIAKRGDSWHRKT